MPWKFKNAMKPGYFYLWQQMHPLDAQLGHVEHVMIEHAAEDETVRVFLRVAAEEEE